MIADANRVFDGYSSQEGGVDGGRKPHLLSVNQMAEAENAIMRGGAPSTRPPIKKLTLIFENSLAYDSSGNLTTGTGDSAANFQTGKFQGAGYYSPRPGEYRVMVLIGGRYYQITPKSNGTTASVYEVPMSPQRNSSSPEIAYMIQADIYHIVQDGVSAPIIYDSVNMRRPTAGEIPCGKAMAYGMNRIVLIGVDDGINFGDIRDGKGNGAADLLGFTEATFLNEGFSSALPSSLGPPTGVVFIPAQDASTGVGECLVTGTTGVEAFNLGIPRETWKDSQFQRTAILGVGNIGHRHLTILNQDLYMRSIDGWRSYRQARAQVNEWAQIPLSTNVRKWIEGDTPWLLQYGSAIPFNNRLIATCTPVPNQGRLYHNGALSLDFDVLSTFGANTNPAWDGHWAAHNLSTGLGLRVLQFVDGIFRGGHRGFAFVLDSNGNNTLREISMENVGQDFAGPITTRCTLRSMDFQSEFNEKSLYGGDVWMDSVLAPTNVTMRLRPDQLPVFDDWYSFSRDVIETTEGDAPVELPGFAPRAALPKPSDDADELATKRLLRRAFEFQPQMEWTGRATMRKFRLHGKVEVEESKANL